MRATGLIINLGDDAFTSLLMVHGKDADILPWSSFTVQTVSLVKKAKFRWILVVYGYIHRAFEHCQTFNQDYRDKQLKSQKGIAGCYNNFIVEVLFSKGAKGYSTSGML